MNQPTQHAHADLNWLGQLVDALGNNPEFAATLQQLAMQWLAPQPQLRQQPKASVDDFVDADYDEDMATPEREPVDDVLQLFADAFGFCAACVMTDEPCEACASGHKPNGPDDRTLLALIVPLLPQLAHETRLELAEHLRAANQDSNAAPGRRRPARPEHHAHY